MSTRSMRPKAETSAGEHLGNLRGWQAQALLPLHRASVVRLLRGPTRAIHAAPWANGRSRLGPLARRTRGPCNSGTGMLRLDRTPLQGAHLTHPILRLSCALGNRRACAHREDDPAASVKGCTGPGRHADNASLRYGTALRPFNAEVQTSRSQSSLGCLGTHVEYSWHQM